MLSSRSTTYRLNGQTQQQKQTNFRNLPPDELDVRGAATTTRSWRIRRRRRHTQMMQQQERQQHRQLPLNNRVVVVVLLMAGLVGNALAVAVPGGGASPVSGGGAGLLTELANGNITELTGSPAPKYQTAYACEGKKLTIECDSGDLINLIRANYGRFSITICNDHGNVEWSVNCMFPKSLPVLNSRCANKQSCSVLATTSMFGDPCPGTHKYLEAHYQCVSAAQTLTTTNRPSPPIVHSNNLPSAPLPPLLANGSTIINGAHVPPPQRMPSSFIVVTPSTSTGLPPIPHTTGARTHHATLSSEFGVVKTGGLPLQPHSPPSVVHHHHHAVNPAIRPPIPASGVGGEHIVLGAPKPTVGASSLSSTSSSIAITQKGASITPVHSSSSPNTRILSGVGGLGGSDDRSTQQQQQHYQPKVTSPVGSSNISVATVIRTINNINTANISEAEANMFCPETMARNLFWNMTRVGDVNVQPCPAGTTGIAKWRCVLMKRLNEDNADVASTTKITTTTLRPLECVNGTCETPMVMANKMNKQRNFEPTWHPLTPDLTQCRSLWLNSLELRVNQRDSSLISIANDLSEVTSSKILYGGDMLVTTKIIQTMSEKMYHDKETFPDQRQREAIIMELLHGVVKTGSNLLDESQLSSWLDLNQEDQMRVATSLLTGLEYNAFLLADTIIRERNVVQKVKNILLSVRVLETKNIHGNEIFPEPEQWHISDDRIELPRAALMENSEGGLVRIVFAAFDRLESILKPSYDHFDLKSARTYVKTTAHLNNDTDNSGSSSQRLRILNSKVISASLGKGRHIQLSQPIKLILKHIKIENVTNPTCVFWNYIDHAWSANGCTLESTNRSHSICMCNHLTNFAILMDVMDEHNHSLFTMFDGNMRILIYISVGICVLFIVIALMTLKIFNGVFIKVRRVGGRRQRQIEQQLSQRRGRPNNIRDQTHESITLSATAVAMTAPTDNAASNTVQDLQQQLNLHQLHVSPSSQNQNFINCIQPNHSIRNRCNNLNANNFQQQQVVTAAAVVVSAGNSANTNTTHLQRGNFQMNNLNLNLQTSQHLLGHNLNQANGGQRHQHQQQTHSNIMESSSAAAVAAATIAAALQQHATDNSNNLIVNRNLNHNNNIHNNNNNSNICSNNSDMNNLMQSNMNDLQYKWWWW